MFPSERKKTQRAGRPPRRDSAGSRHDQAGYTLLHLVAAMSISMVVAMVAQPVVRDVLRQYDMRSASRQLYEEIQRARSSAVMRNTRVRVGIGAQKALLIETLNADTDSWEAGVASREWAKATTGLTVGATNAVVFAGNGSAPVAGLFWVSRTGFPTLFVLVSSGGRIRMYY